MVGSASQPQSNGTRDLLTLSKDHLKPSSSTNFFINAKTVLEAEVLFISEHPQSVSARSTAGISKDSCTDLK